MNCAQCGAAGWEALRRPARPESQLRSSHIRFSPAADLRFAPPALTRAARCLPQAAERFDETPIGLRGEHFTTDQRERLAKLCRRNWGDVIENLTESLNTTGWAVNFLNYCGSESASAKMLLIEENDAEDAVLIPRSSR